MNARPNLRVVNADGEIVQDDPLVLEHEELKRKFFGLLSEHGKLKKQFAELRAVEPEAETIREILEYCRERINKPRQQIVPDGKRWETCRARLRDKLDGRGAWTPAELKLAVDGALLDPWYNGTAPGAPKDRRFLDAATIFKNPERVEKFVDLAMNFTATAGVPLGDLLDVVDHLQFVEWKFVLRVCECEHRRFEHSKGDPNRYGLEPCLMCDCVSFQTDVFDAFNQRVDPHLREWYG